MTGEQLPRWERGDTVKSLRDIGGAAIRWIVEMPERIDTFFADQCNGKDDE